MELNDLNYTHIEAWIEELRVTPHAQGYGHIRAGDKRCAIGVLGDVIDPAGWEASGWKDGNDDNGADLYKHAALTFLPAKMIALGFPDRFVSAVIHLNDRDHRTFGEIACFIEGALYAARNAPKPREATPNTSSPASFAAEQIKTFEENFWTPAPNPFTSGMKGLAAYIDGGPITPPMDTDCSGMVAEIAKLANVTLKAGWIPPAFFFTPEEVVDAPTALPELVGA